VVFGGSGKVLKVVGVEGLCVIKELDFIGLVVLGIVPRVVSLFVWLDVRGGISDFVDLWNGRLVPLVACWLSKVFLPWLVIPS
jgi:hypothetical protein